jgi:hypothetical protein
VGDVAAEEDKIDLGQVGEPRVAAPRPVEIHEGADA